VRPVARRLLAGVPVMAPRCYCAGASAGRGRFIIAPVIGMK
jgi:hypothetical protein